MRHKLAALCATLLTALATTPSAAAPLLIRGVRIVDPDAGVAGPATDLLIQRDKVVRIAPHLRAPRGATVVDAAGLYATPGLWDMHAHIAALNPVGAKPEGYVGHGVLGVRDMGGHLAELQALKNEIAAGRAAPFLVMAGPTLNGQAFADFHRVVATPEAGRAAVRDLKSAGIDFIKVHRATSRATFLAISDEARRERLDVAGHVPLEMKWSEAAEAGIHSIEHMQTILENEVQDQRSLVQIQQALQRVQGPYGAAMWASLVRNGVYFDPTLIAYKRSVETAAPQLAATRQLLYPQLLTMVKQASDAGVMLLSGTDVVVQPGGDLLRELGEFAAAGLPAPRILRAATSDAARAARRPALARVRSGGPASLLLVQGDPLADIRNMNQLKGAVLRGRWLPETALAALRAQDTAPLASAVPPQTEQGNP